MDPGEEAGLLASLRERALQYEEAVRTVRERDEEFRSPPCIRLR